jgi:molecular chaperone DnaK (HSP70)
MSDLNLKTLVPQTTNQELVQDQLRNTTFVGIDFGTSTSVASYAVPGDEEQPIQAEPIPIPQKQADGSTYSHHLIPSVLAWYRDQLYVGVGARELSETNKVSEGKSVWSSFKMDLGVDLGPQYNQSVLRKGKEDIVIETPVDAAAVFLRYVRSHIEDFVEEQGLPKDIQYSISIPASFEPNQREDLMKALGRAGIDLPEQGFIDEPNAAFLNFLTEANMFGEHEPLQIPSEAPLRVLVFDFGAGTCDISILEVGQDIDGFYSKNLAISRFEVLGGDNIDRQIVREVLLDQLCEENDVEKGDLRRTDIEKRIIPALKRHAERLKISASKRVASEQVGLRLPSMATDADKSVRIDDQIEISLPRQTLLADHFELTLAGFRDVMDPFLDSDGTGGARDDEVSVFQPVKSAISKAEIEPSDLDMTLLIGGSSKNPYLQAALVEYFEEEYAVEVEIPRDLRAHVSTGASVNSLVLNGFGNSIVRPITSEPIYAIIQGDGGETLHSLVEASTEIPSPTSTIEDLKVGQEGQQSVQIPICVGSRRKVMSILEIEAPTGKGFEEGTGVHLDVKITEDKLLLARARVEDQEAAVEIARPFANQELSPQERKIRGAEKAANNAMAGQGGRASIPALLELAKTCAKAGNHLRAAEIFEQVQMTDPTQKLERTISHQFSEAGRHDLAYEWAEKAYDRKKSAINAYNLAVSAKNSEGDLDTYVEYMEEALDLKGSYTPALVSLGLHLNGKGEERGRELLEKAFEILKQRRENNRIGDDRLLRLQKVARALGKYDLVDVIEEELNTSTSDSEGGLYDESRLATNQSSTPDQDSEVLDDSTEARHLPE